MTPEEIIQDSIRGVQSACKFIDSMNPSAKEKIVAKDVAYQIASLLLLGATKYKALDFDPLEYWNGFKIGVAAALHNAETTDMEKILND